jgi:competence protein ComFC
MLKENSINPTFFKPSLNLWALLDWIFPPFCVHCQKIGYEICPECWNDIPRLSSAHTCSRCGKQIVKGQTCRACRDLPPAYDQLKSWSNYDETVREMVIGIKYQRRLGLVRYLTPALADLIRNWQIDVDVMAPVPLGEKRLRERGYNQADLIAKPLAKTLHIPYRPPALRRVRETRSQVGLDAEERRVNLISAFKADPEICRDQSFLILDDIATTGATLDACAAALREAGAKNVFCITVARTNLSPNSNPKNTEVRI